MRKAIEQKPKGYWLNLMVEKGLITEEQASKNLVHNEILGYVTPKEIERAVELKAIKRIRKDNIVYYAITSEEIIVNGKKKLAVSQTYLNYEKNRQAKQGASYYKAQELQELDEVMKEVDEIFPNNIKL